MPTSALTATLPAVSAAGMIALIKVALFSYSVPPRTALLIIRPGAVAILAHFAKNPFPHVEESNIWATPSTNEFPSGAALDSAYAWSRIFGASTNVWAANLI